MLSRENRTAFAYRQTVLDTAVCSWLSVSCSTGAFSLINLNVEHDFTVFPRSVDSKSESKFIIKYQYSDSDSLQRCYDISEPVSDQQISSLTFFVYIYVFQQEKVIQRTKKGRCYICLTYVGNMKAYLVTSLIILISIAYKTPICYLLHMHKHNCFQLPDERESPAMGTMYNNLLLSDCL